MDAITTMTEHDIAFAFEGLLQRHRGIVFKVAHTYCHDIEDRAELAQEIATQLWRAFPSFNSERSASTWMYRVALNVAISHVRHQVARRGRTVSIDEDLHDVAGDDAANPESQQQVHQLQRFIARQAPLDRALLLLYLDDRPQREIAEVLGLTETNVSTKIARLKQRIRSEL